MALISDLVNPLDVTYFDPLMPSSKESYGPPSPPWEEGDILKELEQIQEVISHPNIMDDFLSSSPSSMILEEATDRTLDSFFTENGDQLGDLMDESQSDMGKDLSSESLAPKVDKDNNLVKHDVERKVDRDIVGYCSVCKLVFSSEAQLAEHRLAYAQETACCQCCKKFSTMSKLRVHHRKHSKEKPFQCLSCGKYYSHRQSMAKHQLLYCKPLLAKGGCSSKLATVPSNVKQSNCDSSSKTQNNSVANSVLQTHCRICDVEFHDVKSFQNHNEYFIGQRKCCHCHKVLGNKSKLLTHHRSHTKEFPYVCKVCNKKFAENSTLRKHAATHGERNFRCNVCSRAFVRKDYLVKHEATHQQTYKCSQCQYVCHSKLDIESHVSSTH